MKKKQIKSLKLTKKLMKIPKLKSLKKKIKIRLIQKTEQMKIRRKENQFVLQLGKEEALHLDDQSVHLDVLYPFVDLSFKILVRVFEALEELHSLVEA